MKKGDTMADRKQTRRTIVDSLNAYGQARQRRKEILGPDLIDTVVDVVDIAATNVHEASKAAVQNTANFVLDTKAKASDFYDKQRSNWQEAFQGMKDQLQMQKANFYATLDARGEMRAQRAEDSKEFFNNVKNKGKELAVKVGTAVGKTATGLYNGGRHAVNRARQEMKNGTGFLAASIVGLSAAVQSRYQAWKAERRDTQLPLRERVANRLEAMTNRLRAPEEKAINLRSLDRIASNGHVVTDKNQFVADLYMSYDNKDRDQFKRDIVGSKTVELRGWAFNSDFENADPDISLKYDTKELNTMFKDLDAYIKDQERIAKIDKHMTEIESKYSFLNPEMESANQSNLVEDMVTEESPQAENGVSKYPDAENIRYDENGDVASVEIPKAEVGSAEWKDAVNSFYANAAVRELMLNQYQRLSAGLEATSRDGYGVASVVEREAELNELYEEMAYFVAENPGVADDLIERADEATPSYMKRAYEVTPENAEKAAKMVELLTADRDTHIETDAKRAADSHRTLTFYQNGLNEYQATQSVMQTKSMGEAVTPDEYQTDRADITEEKPQITPTYTEELYDSQNNVQDAPFAEFTPHDLETLHELTTIENQNQDQAFFDSLQGLEPPVVESGMEL